MADTHVAERRSAQFETSQDVRTEHAPLTRLPAYQAYRVLHAGFTLAPILAGADKFFHLMTNWDMYLATPVAKILPFSAHTFMLIVGVIEIAAGILVAVLPRVGGFVVAAWLMGIVVNLLLPPGYYDIALRDFGLALGAFSLGLLARQFGSPFPGKHTVTK